MPEVHALGASNGSGTITFGTTTLGRRNTADRGPDSAADPCTIEFIDDVRVVPRKFVLRDPRISQLGTNLVGRTVLGGWWSAGTGSVTACEHRLRLGTLDSRTAALPHGDVCDVP